MQPIVCASRVHFAICLMILALLATGSARAQARSVSFAGFQTPVGYGLNHAEAVAVDAAGNVHIADTGNNRVIELPPGCASSACQKTIWTGSEPHAVAVDKGGDVFVYANRDTNPGGAILVEIPAGCTSPSCHVILNDSTFLYEGESLAVDPSGDLFVAAKNADTVYEVTPSCIAAASMSCWQTLLTVPRPVGVAVDAAGNAFVSSDAPHEKQLVEVPANCSGNCQVVLYSDSNGRDGLGGVAVDAADDLFIVPSDEFGRRSLVVIPVECTSTSCRVTLSTGLGQSPSGAQLLTDSVGDLFVVDVFHNRLFKFERIAPKFGHVSVGSNTAQTIIKKDARGNPNVRTAPQITSASTTTFTAGQSGTFMVTTTGTPTPRLSETGSLPTGVTFADNRNGTATIGGASDNTGTYPIIITAKNGVSPNATQNFTLTVNGQTQTITFTSVPPKARYLSLNNVRYPGVFTVSATGGGSNNPIVFTSSGVCTNSGATYTMTAGTGTCSVIANQAGNNIYAPGQATASVEALKAFQMITVSQPAPSQAKTGASFRVAAFTSSGLQVVYRSNIDECSNVGPNYTITAKKGYCAVEMTQPGNSNYLPANSVGERVKIVNTAAPPH